MEAGARRSVGRSVAIRVYAEAGRLWVGAVCSDSCIRRKEGGRSTAVGGGRSTAVDRSVAIRVCAEAEPYVVIPALGGGREAGPRTVGRINGSRGGRPARSGSRM